MDTLHTVEVQIILNGPRNLILAVYMQSVGEAGGELVKYPLITAEEAGIEPDQRLRFQHIASSIVGYSACLEFDSGLVTPTRKWVLSEHVSEIDFCDYVHLRDTSGIDGTGALLISTTGFADAGDQGSFLVCLRKP